MSFSCAYCIHISYLVCTYYLTLEQRSNNISNITMINRRQSRRTIVAFVGVCIIIVAASLLILSQVEIDLFSDDHISSSRRFLQSITIDEESIYSYAEKGLIPVTEPPNPKNEVSLFWHIPKVSIVFLLLLIFAFAIDY